MSTLDFGGHVHSRNLKIISLAFILFQLLDMQLLNGDGRLMMIPVRIGNEELLPYVADAAFLYFVWRFWLDAKSAGVRSHLRRLSEFSSNTIAQNGKASAAHLAASEVLIKELIDRANMLIKKRNVEDNVIHRIVDLVWRSNSKKYLISFDQNSGSPQTISLHWYELLDLRLKLLLWRLWKLNVNVPNGELKGQSYHDVIITWVLAFLAFGIILWPVLHWLFEVFISCLEYLYALVPPSSLW